MENNSPTSGAAVSNTDPGIFPGTEPVYGQHVTLERLTPNHFSELWETVGCHNDVWTWWPDERYNTPADFDHALNYILAEKDLVSWAVFPLSGPNKGKAVGCAFAQPGANLAYRVAEIGIVFGPFLQRTREATEVTFLLLRLLFDDLNYRRVQWKTNSMNLASKKAAERYGLVYEGTFRQHMIIRGKSRDTDWYSMIDSEWPICKKVFQAWLEDGNFDDQRRQKRSMQEIRASLK